MSVRSWSAFLLSPFGFRGAVLADKATGATANANAAANNFQQQRQAAQNAVVTVCEIGVYCPEGTPLQLMRTPRCKHPANVCKEDLLYFLNRRMVDMKVAHLKCAADRCREKYTLEEFRKFAPAADYENAQRLETVREIRSMTEFVWCMGVDCTNGQLIYEGNIMTCSVCNAKTCVSCVDRFHPGETCAAFLERRAQDPSYIAKLAATKKCPNCGVNIEKVDGCDHMLCKMCLHEFCWECFADFKNIVDNDNSRHNPTCRFHSDNVGRNVDGVD